MLVHPPPTNHKHLKSKNPRKPVSANNFELLFELLAKIKQSKNKTKYSPWINIMDGNRPKCSIYVYCIYKLCMQYTASCILLEITTESED